MSSARSAAAKSPPSQAKKSTALSPETVEYLKAWMMSPEHVAHPYPTKQEKADIMAETGIELKQLTTWFVNNRKRYWRPRVEANLNNHNSDANLPCLLAAKAHSIEQETSVPRGHEEEGDDDGEEGDDDGEEGDDDDRKRSTAAMAVLHNVTLAPGPLGITIDVSAAGTCLVTDRPNPNLASPLQIGDEILSLNGIKLADVDCDEGYKMFCRLKGWRPRKGGGGKVGAWVNLFRAFDGAERRAVVRRGGNAETPVPRGHEGEGEDEGADDGRHQAPPPAHATPANDAETGEAEDPNSPRFPSSRLICPISHMVPLDPCHFMGGDQVFDKDALLWYINRPRPLFFDVDDVGGRRFDEEGAEDGATAAASIFRAGREDNSVLDPVTGEWIDKAEALAGITPVSKEVRHKVMHNAPKGVYVWCDIDPVTKEPRTYWRLGMALLSSILKRLSAGKGYVACLGMLYKFMPTADPETVETFLRYVLWKMELQIDSRNDDLAAKVVEIWEDASLQYIDFDYESDHYRLLENHVVKMSTSVAAYNESGLLSFEVFDKDVGETITLDIHTFARRPDFRDWFRAHSKGSANPWSYDGVQQCFECDNPAQFGYYKEPGDETVHYCHLHLPRCTRENCSNWTTLGELCFLHTPCSRGACNFPVVDAGLCRGCRREHLPGVSKADREQRPREKHRAVEARKAAELKRWKAELRQLRSLWEEDGRKARYLAAYYVYEEYRERGSNIDQLDRDELIHLIKFVVPEEGKSDVHGKKEAPSHFTTVVAMKNRLASCDPAWSIYFDPDGLDASNGAGDGSSATRSARAGRRAGKTALEEAIESAVRSAEGVVDPGCLQRAIDAGFSRGFVLEQAKIRLALD